MGAKGQHETGIEWTHVPGYVGATWNPVRGCTKISPGCKNCYAETFAERWRGVAGHPYEQGFDLRLVPAKLDEPLRKTKPHAYFVNSMSDLFQDGAPFDYVARVCETMAMSQQHLYMVLTKRAERMAQFAWWWRTTQHPHTVGTYASIYGAPLPNVWLGASVEDRKYGLPRVDVLRTIPAAVRFLSVEPLLEDLGDIDLTGIHWVIVGGESGHGARPFRPWWAYRILEQCRKQGVPFFMKQMGENAQTDDYMDLPSDHFRALDSNGDLPRKGFPIRIMTRTRKGHDLYDLPEDLRVREWPKAVQPCA